jgi:hypothetical protein
LDYQIGFTNPLSEQKYEIGSIKRQEYCLEELIARNREQNHHRPLSQAFVIAIVQNLKFTQIRF